MWDGVVKTSSRSQVVKGRWQAPTQAFGERAMCHFPCCVVSFSPLPCWYGLKCVPSKKIKSPSLPYLRIWSYLEIGFLQRWSSPSDVARVGPSPTGPCPSIKQKSQHRSDTHRGKVLWWDTQTVPHRERKNENNSQRNLWGHRGWKRGERGPLEGG